MITSKYFSLYNASENKRQHPKDIQFPHCADIKGFYVDQNTKYPVSAEPAFSSFSKITDTTRLGAYSIRTPSAQPDDHGQVDWSAPGEFTNYDLTYTDGVTGITTLTGAGTMQFASASGYAWYAVTLVNASIVVRERALGRLSQTGEWMYPFGYTETITSIEPMAHGDISCVLDGLYYLLATNGFMYKTDGVTLQRVDGVFSGAAVQNDGVPAKSYSGISNGSTLVWSPTYCLFRADLQPSGTTVFVDMQGNYTQKYEIGDSYITTGLLPLMEENTRVHVQAVRVRIGSASGSVNGIHIRVGVKDVDEDAWHMSPDYYLPSGSGAFIEQTIPVGVNVKNPHAKITISGGGASVFGLTVIYDDGGRRDVSE
jgi:hypothetical protein